MKLTKYAIRKKGETLPCTVFVTDCGDGDDRYKAYRLDSTHIGLSDGIWLVDSYELARFAMRPSPAYYNADEYERPYYSFDMSNYEIIPVTLEF